MPAKETAAPVEPGKGRKPSGAEKALAGILDGLNAHVGGGLQFEDTQEWHDKLVIACCVEVIDYETDNNLLDVDKKTMERLDAVSKILKGLRPEKSDFAASLTGTMVTYGEEAAEELEEFERRMYWELTADEEEEGLQKVDTSHLKYLMSLTTILGRIKGTL